MDFKPGDLVVRTEDDYQGMNTLIKVGDKRIVFRCVEKSVYFFDDSTGYMKRKFTKASELKKEIDSSPMYRAILDYALGMAVDAQLLENGIFTSLIDISKT